LHRAEFIPRLRTHLPWLAWLLWLAFCGWVILFRTTLTTDLTFFLPRDAGLVDAVLIQQMREGPASRVLLIALEGGGETQRAETSRRLADALRDHPLFEAVDNGHDPDLLQKLEARLFPYRYLLSPDVSPERFEPAALHWALQSRLAELASPVAFVQKAWLPRDPTGEWQGLLQRWLTVEGPSLRQGVWFSRNGQRALILARTQASGFDIDVQSRVLDEVRERFEAVRTAPSLRLVLSGPGPLSVESNTRIAGDAGRLSAINSILVMALLFAVYRSFRVLGLGVIPLASGVVSGVAVTSLAFGGIHGITLGFGATLVGVAADYPNHFFTHLSERESPATTMARIWPTLRLGVLTNIAGFAAMLFSGFSGLVQLAVFAAGGLAGAALASRWVIPAFTPRAVRLPGWVEHGGGLARLPFWLGRLRWLPLLLTAGLVAAFALSGERLWDDDIDALNPVPAERKQLDEALRRDLGAPDLSKLIVVLAPDAESALRISEDLRPALDGLERQGALGRYDMAALYLPSRRTQSARQAALPERAKLAASLNRAQAGLPFKPGAFGPFLDDIATAKTMALLERGDLRGTPLGVRVESLLFPLNSAHAGLLPAAKGMHTSLQTADSKLPLPLGEGGGEGIKRFQSFKNYDSVADSELTRKQSHLASPHPNPLPEGERKRHWAALVPLTDIKDEAALRHALQPWQARGVHYADLREETTRLVRDYRSEALRLLGGSLAVIVALLALGLRSVRAMLRVFSPMLAAALCTALVMACVSRGMTLYHLVSLLLVMGLSLDQALFFNRDSADPEDRHRTLLSLLVCSSSSVLAFGTLALSEINILRAIGSTVALGAFLAVAFAAMLARQAPSPR
jgi:predicted exporter